MNVIKTNIKTIYNNNVLLLLATVFLNNLGIGIVQMYSLIYIYSKTNSNFYAAVQGAIILGAGVVSSYFYVRHKKDCNLMRYILISEFTCFLITIVIAYEQTVILLYINLIVVYLVYGFFKPSYHTVLYYASHPKHITQTNATSSMLCNLAFIFGWIVAPLCFNAINYSSVFLFAALAHLASSIIILVIMPEMKQSIISTPSNITELQHQQDHKNYTLQTEQSPEKNILLFNILFLVVSITIMTASLTALEMGIFKEIYHLSDTFVGLFFISWISGGVIAGVVNNFCSNRFFKNTWLLRINILIFMFFALVFVYYENKYIGIIIYIICGFLYFFSDIFSDNYIYHKTIKEKHAYNFGLKNMIVNGVMLICVPILGYIADIISIPTTMIIAIILSFFIVILETTGLDCFFIKKIRQFSHVL